MNKLELRVQQNPGTIELNFDELNAALDARLAEYDGAVFTEETKDIAKGEVASLRKLKKEIDDKRKLVKREWNKPFEIFEANMKVLLAKVDEPINAIDEQLKAFEEKRKKEKKEKIEELYVELIEDMAEYIPLNSIYMAKWENATTTMKSIKEEIVSEVKAAQAAVAMISGMQSDAVEKALEIYRNTHDSVQAVTYINNYEKQKQEIMKREEERRRQAEIDRVRRMEREALEREERARREAEEVARKSMETNQASMDVEKDFENLPNDTETDESEMPFVTPSTVSVKYRIVATAQEVEELEVAMDSLGIFFERLDA
ncbi:DUF1351 domain-containing protein [Mediterraneibacter sp. ICN-202921]|uniref:DUF1351 domain-containing protein n=1 Tax=Mediterraneibacter sp. ICN-202921 TaxID=3134657 RepID=UPI0030BD187F